MLLMLVIPVSGSPATINDDLELRIFAGKFGSNVGIGVTFEAFNKRNEPVNVTFLFVPLVLRPWLWLSPIIPLEIERTVGSYQIVRETCYFPPLSVGAFYALAHERYNSSDTMVFRTGFHYRQRTFLNPSHEN
jgi:hypothetical protein